MKLVLIRHGKTEANEKRLYCGSTDLTLSETGKRELVTKKAKCIYPDMRGLRFATSGMIRTNETMRVLFDRDPDEVIPELKEMDFGRFEMHSYEELKEDPDYLKWIMDESGCTPADGGESTRDFHMRIFAAIDALRKDYLIVTHGGVITAIMWHLFPDENKGFYDWQPQCGCGYIVDTTRHTYEKISE